MKSVLPPPPYAPEQQVRRLGLRVAQRLDGLLQGEHARRQVGPGSEPTESRLYGVGDDARRIDWAVTARTGETHSRTTTADRELETTLVVDLSPSMSFGTQRSEKRDLAVAVATALVQLTSGHGDRVGALLLTGDGVRRVPPRSGRDAGLALRHVLATQPRTESGPGADLAPVLAALARPPSRRGLVVVLSDLLEPGSPDEPAWARPLRLLGQRCHVVVGHVSDPRESVLPAAGTVQLVDPESGRRLEVRTTRALRDRYAAAAELRTAGHHSAVRGAGADLVVLRTDRDWLPELARALSSARPARTPGPVAARG